jgi:hypothetical protein
VLVVSRVESSLIVFQSQLTVGMSNDFDNLSGSASANLTIYPLQKIHAASNQLPTPTLISKAMIPEEFASKRRYGICTVSDEAASGMAIQGQEERHKEMMCIPKGLVGLLSDLLMCGRVDE